MNNTMQLESMDGGDIKDIQLSFGRCLTSSSGDGTFLEIFYGLFVDSHPDIKTLFSDTDLAKQRQLLQVGLNMVILFTNSDEFVAQDVLKKIRKSHCKERLNIKPELYKYWINSLIEVIQIKDSKFNDELESKWRAVLQNAVDYIAAGYDE